MLPSWCTQTIKRLRPGTKTVRGSVIPDWDNADELQIGGCSVQPASTSLSEDGRVLGITDGWTAYLPESADVMAGDHIVFNGNTYEINGEPRTWQSPTGHNNHVMLNLRRFAG